MTFRRLLLIYGALDSHPFFPSHVAPGRCFLSAAAAVKESGTRPVVSPPACSTFSHSHLHRLQAYLANLPALAGQTTEDRSEHRGCLTHSAALAATNAPGQRRSCNEMDLPRIHCSMRGQWEHVTDSR